MYQNSCIHMKRSSYHSPLKGGLRTQSAYSPTTEHFSFSSITKNQSRPTFCQISQIANHIKPISITLHSAKAITKLFFQAVWQNRGMWWE
jgi:hypothetical protein